MTGYSKKDNVVLRAGKYYANKPILLEVPTDMKHPNGVPLVGFFYTPCAYTAKIAHDGTTIYPVRWPNISDWQQYSAQIVDNMHCKSCSPGERFQKWYVRYHDMLRHNTLVAQAMGISRTSVADFVSGRRS